MPRQKRHIIAHGNTFSLIDVIRVSCASVGKSVRPTEP